MGLEQNFFNFLKRFITNRIAKVFAAILNVLVIAVNCAQFYFLKLKLTFGGERYFMLLAFFAGMFLAFSLFKLISRIKLKKQKIRQIKN